MSSPDNVVVTGAAGFVGQHIVDALRFRGAKVLPVAHRAGRSADPFVDVSDRKAVDQLFSSMPRPHSVVHLAALAHRKREPISDADYDRVNRQGLENVLRAARSAGVQRFIFFSTASVYGDHESGAPVSEDAERRPVGAYARSKRDAEDACFAAAAEGFDCIVFRPPAIYSREWLLDVRKRAYVPGFGRILLEIRGPQPRYSFCAVKHAAQVACLAVDGELAGGTYNVADATPYTQQEVREVVATLDGARQTLPIPARPVRALLTVISRAASQKMRSALWGNYAKLFEGQVLDLSKLRSAGVYLPATLHDLVDPVDHAAPLVGGAKPQMQ